MTGYCTCTDRRLTSPLWIWRGTIQVSRKVQGNSCMITTTGTDSVLGFTGFVGVMSQKPHITQLVRACSPAAQVRRMQKLADDDEVVVEDY